MEQLVGLVLLAGELLLTTGAEMYRVEETIERMGLAAGFSHVEGFATPTGLFISLHAPDGRVYTRVRRIRRVANNLEIISKINAISRSFSEGELSLDDVERELLRLQGLGFTKNRLGPLIGGAGAVAFTIMYGGNWFEALIAGVTGTLVMLATACLEGHPVPKVLQASTGAIVAAGFVMAVGEYWTFNTNVVTLGAIMLLVPGMLMTTAIRDVLSGELVSGVTRGAEALAIAVAVAMGVAVILSMGGR